MQKWKKGGIIGASMISVIGFIVLVVASIVNGDSGTAAWMGGFFLFVIGPSFFGYCIGALIGRYFDINPMPYWLKGAVTLCLALFVVSIFGLLTVRDDGILGVLVLIIAAPIPFIIGSIIGWIYGKIKNRKQPSMTTN